MTASEFLANGLEATFWVSLLTILALGLRGPVTKRFGSRAAMLLWLMPALRLIAPTFTKTVEVALPTEEPAAPLYEPASWTMQTASAGSLPAPKPAPEPLVWIDAETGTEAVLGFAQTEAVTQPMLGSLWAVLSTLMTEEFVASFVLSVWFLGVLIAFALCFARAARWRETLLAEAQEVPDDIAKKAEAAAARAGATRPFTLVVSGAAETPQLMGLGKPILALPQDFTDRYDEDEQEMALLHELTHLRRRDLSVLMASEAAFALQWFNPLSRHARKALRADQEAACDEAVRGLGVNTKSYAALLLKTASMGRPLPALTLNHSLKERLIRMQNPLNAPLKRYAFILTAGVSALAVAGFTASTTTVTTYLQDNDQSEERAASAVNEVDQSWESFLKSVENGSGDADERWAEYVARVEADQQRNRAVSDDEWAEARAAASRSGQAAREEASREAREASREVWEEARAERDRAHALREKAHAERERAHALRERARTEQAQALSVVRELALVNPQESDGGEPRIVLKRVVRDAEGKELDFDLDLDTLSIGDKEGDLKKQKKVRVLRLDDAQVAEGQHFEFHHEDGDGPVVLRLGQEFPGERELRFFTEDHDGEGPVVMRFGGETAGNGVFVSGDGQKKVRVLRDNGQGFNWMSSDHNMAMVLLSDPFADIEQPDMAPPPAPEVAVEPPVIERRETEEGTWILIPKEPDMSGFEAVMEEFEEKMEAFGERMEAWGERMGNAGEAVGELSERCAEHIEDSDEPKILSVRIEDSRERVRALCVSGGEDRLKSEEVKRFIRGAGLSSDERKHFEDATKKH